MSEGAGFVGGAEAAKDKKPSTGVSSIATVLIAGFVPGSTLALLLLGYGYSQAVSSQFGVDAEQIASSFSDYLQLSAYAVLFLFTRLSDLLGSWETYRRLYADLGWGLVVAVVLVVVGGWWVVRRPISGCSSALKKVRDVQRCGGKSWSIAIVAAVVGVVVSPALMLVVMLGLMLVIGLVYVLIPSFGFAIGLTALHELVVKPEQCVPLRTRQVRMAPTVSGQGRKDGKDYVHCVALKRDGKEIARGRLVLATSQGVLLFHPITGHVLQMSSAEVSVHPVDSLDQPAGAEQWL